MNRVIQAFRLSIGLLLLVGAVECMLPLVARAQMQDDRRTFPRRVEVEEYHYETVLVPARQPDVKPIRVERPVLGFSLEQNYPNPFNPSTQIRFTLQAAGHVEVVVFNAQGEAVARLLDGALAAGEHTVDFNAGQFASGMYAYWVKCDGVVQMRWMMLMK